MHVKRTSPQSTSQAGRHRRGVHAAEFALTLPILLVLLWACFEFGRFYMIRLTADNAAYEAARHAMVPGATAAEAQQKATELLAILGTNGAEIAVAPSVLDEDVDEVTVTIQIPFEKNALLLPQFLGGIVLNHSATLRTERYNPVPD